MSPTHPPKTLPTSLGLILLGLVGAGCPSTTPAPDSEAGAAPAPTPPAEPSSAEASASLVKLANLDALRDAFNADADKGRVILLLEPG